MTSVRSCVAIPILDRHSLSGRPRTEVDGAVVLCRRQYALRGQLAIAGKNKLRQYDATIETRYYWSTPLRLT